MMKTGCARFVPMARWLAMVRERLKLTESQQPGNTAYHRAMTTYFVSSHIGAIVGRFDIKSMTKEYQMSQKKWSN